MSNRTFCIRLLLLTALTVASSGQTPINDTLVVTFPNDVRVGTQLLKAGEYTIRQLGTASSPRLLEFTTNKGTSIQASATAIATIDNNNRNESSAIIENLAGEQHLHRLWIRGKTYGYEFPLDESNSLRREASTSSSTRLTATYTPPAAPVEVAVFTPAAPPTASEAPTPAATPEPAAPAAAPEPPVQAATPQPTPAPDAVASEPAQTTVAQTTTPAMPKTSLNWATYCVAGAGFLFLANAFKGRRRIG